MRSLLRNLVGERVASFRKDSADNTIIQTFSQSQLSADWIEPLKHHLRSQRRVKNPHPGLQRDWEVVGKGSALHCGTVGKGRKILIDNYHASMKENNTIVEYDYAIF